ncbi:glycosyltransferase family 69 protein [Ceratocystis lukuohia]|uniref:Glycosyltransferase family 69 protein n=1 Tax=Ceratocystis lukuohia TaxID=2019550 RepID=A0ABR4MJU9_9PEZI
MARNPVVPPNKRRTSPPPLLPFDMANGSYQPQSSYTVRSFRMRLRRVMRTPWPRVFICLFALLQVLDIVNIHLHLAVVHDSSDIMELSRRHQGERIYIASMHWNDGPLIRNHWSNAVLQLADVLGPDNVYVSVYESGSWDDTKDALGELEAKLERLGVARSITRSYVTHKDEIEAAPVGDGWINTPRNKRELRRIPFLAKLRNRTLRDLETLHKQGVHFDKILFLNDVVFTAEDALRLLDTNEGVFAAACSLDFSKPPQYYDTFALRDSDGKAHLMPTWPYFQSAASRNAMLLNEAAVPVKSCWNGIVAMAAAPFLDASKPLRFRGIPDSLAIQHLEGSECCLIHADNPMSKEMGVFLNPQVRVAYNYEAYQATHPLNGESWLTWGQIAKGLWESRIRRLFTFTFTKDWVVSSRIRSWKSQSHRNSEPGDFCLINEMQVLVENGWAHV